MNIGHLTHRLRIKTTVLTHNGGGGFTVEWQEVAEVFAAISDLSGLEMLQDAQITSSALRRIVIHYRNYVTAKMRLADDTARYDIVSLRDPDGGKSWLEIIAQMK